jgi:hypothetical protein
MSKKISLIPYQLEVEPENKNSDIEEIDELSEKKPEQKFKVCLTKKGEGLVPFFVYSEIGYNAIECVIKRAKMMIGLVPVYGAKIKKIRDDNSISIFAIETVKCDDNLTEWVEDYSKLPEEYVTAIEKLIPKN